MPTTISFSIPLTFDATVGRDLTRVRLTQRVAATALVGTIDDQTTSIVLREIDALKVGCQIHFPDSGELMTVTAIGATASDPITVERATTGDTPVPGYLTNVPAPHQDGQQVFVLQFGGLVDMGIAAAKAVIANYILQMGAASETVGSAMITQSQAAQQVESALNNVLQ